MLCIREANALARLGECAGLSKPWLPTDGISIEISCAGLNNVFSHQFDRKSPKRTTGLDKLKLSA